MQLTRINFILFALISIALIVHVQAAISAIYKMQWLTDYHIFYQSAKLFLDKKNIYSQFKLQPLAYPFLIFKNSAFLIGGNLNPPLFTLLISPLALLSYKISFATWLGLSLAAGLLSVYIVIRTYEWRLSSPFSLWLVALYLCFYPTLGNIEAGQVTAFILLLLVASWSLARKGNGTFAGICLGIALNIKIFTGIFVIYYLIRREWGIIKSLSITILLCLLITLIIFGPITYLNYLTKLNEVTWYANNWNGSVLGFITRLLGDKYYYNIYFSWPSLTRPLYYLIVTASILIYIKLIWPKKTNNTMLHHDLGFAMTIVIMLLLSPLGWLYYFDLLLISSAITLQLSLQGNAKSTYHTLLVISLMLCSFPFPIFSTPPQQIHLLRLLTDYNCYFYALCLLLGLQVTLWFKLQKRDAINAEQLPAISYVNILLCGLTILPSLIDATGIHAGLIIVLSGLVIGLLYLELFSVQKLKQINASLTEK